MAEMRLATVADAELIAAQRRAMFADNDLATAERLDTLEAANVPWLRERLGDGRYVGLLLEEDGVCVAGAGIFYADFPPHWLDTEAVRPYLLNFYTAGAARGKGYAKQLLGAAVEHCRARGCRVVVLHASKFGRPIYEKFGFAGTNEMMLRLGEDDGVV